MEDITDEQQQNSQNQEQTNQQTEIQQDTSNTIKFEDDDSEQNQQENQQNNNQQQQSTDTSNYQQTSVAPQPKEWDPQQQINEQKYSDQEQNQNQNQNQGFQEEENKYQQQPQKQKSLSKDQISNNQERSVYVVDPKTQDSVKNFVSYTIKGVDADGPFESLRRFSDFWSYRSILIQRWPACYVPPLPPKKAFGNQDQNFVEDRRAQLETFVQCISEFPPLWNSEETKIFLRSPAATFEKTINSLAPLSHDLLIKKYEDGFKQLAGKEINTELIIKINSFSQYLKKITPMLENYKQMCKNMINEQKLSNDHLSIFIGYVLPEYEKNSIVEYVEGDKQDKLILSQNSDKLIEINQQLGLFQIIRHEIREIEAFQEAMQTRDSYEQMKQKSIKKREELNNNLTALMSNKSTVKGFFTTKNKNEQVEVLQTQIEDEKKNIENLGIICDIMTVILGYIEIDQFKKQKELIYYQVLRKIAEFEVAYNSKLIEFWQFCLDDKNIQNR